MVEKNKSTISEAKMKQMEAKIDEENEISYENQPASDVYAKAEGKDPETGVEIPTEESVEEAKNWADEHRQM